MSRKRKATKCEACGFPSWSGRVCAYCKKFYGGAENAIAGSALARRMATMTYDQVCDFMLTLFDVVVPDFPGPSLPRLLHSSAVSAADRQR